MLHGSPGLTALWRVDIMPLDTLAMVVQAEGRREMERTDDRVALAEREDTEATSRQAEAAYAQQRAGEKPEASEEIVIEEINIDGMCGVY